MVPDIISGDEGPEPDGICAGKANSIGDGDETDCQGVLGRGLVGRRAGGAWLQRVVRRPAGRRTVRGYWAAALLGAVLGAPGCNGSSDDPPVGAPPPDLPKTPAEYEKSAPREKV